MRVFVSGLHSGPNPSPGVGVARSLKQAFPQVTLIGVDYSVRSSGIHYDGFDELWLQRPWNELDLDLYCDQIRQVLKSDALWISGLDLEVQWLAKVIPNEPKILVPLAVTFARFAKPSFSAALRLPVAIPPYIPVNRPTLELYAFCRRYGWPVWCKGPNYEARQAKNWREVLEAVAEMQKVWSTQHLALQAHVRGEEESIAFGAYQGKLLDCVRMEKRLQTPEGKTWAGHISQVSDYLEEQLQRVVADLGWTGGAELEFVRDEQDILHLIDWNPRFPAWIYGATLAGHNLPARLLEAVGLDYAHENAVVSREFVRVVIEIPVRNGYVLPSPSPPAILDSKKELGKHPSGMPLLAKRLAGEKPPKAGSPPARMPDTILRDLTEMRLQDLATPHRVFLQGTAQQAFKQARSLNLGNGKISARLAYSVKTNPREEFMTLARQHGLLAEVINGLELQHAVTCGFPFDRIILNGPAQGWPASVSPGGRLYAIFADSLERLEVLLQQEVKAHFVGVRLKPVTVSSRFGIDLESFEGFCDLVGILKRLDDNPLGVHFHIQSDVTGVRHWWEIYEATLHWARAVQDGVGRSVRCLDIGGGWLPDDFAEEFLQKVPKAIERAQDLLPDLRAFLIEPGRALAQPCMALVTRVLEVRNRGKPAGTIEAIVDAATSDIPMSTSFPHRVLLLTGEGQLTLVPDGQDRILGRNCMESDALATMVELPPYVSAGDTFVICDVGAYDTSMSYGFGTGRSHDT